jgi:hypothetical protein
LSYLVSSKLTITSFICEPHSPPPTFNKLTSSSQLHLAFPPGSTGSTNSTVACIDIPTPLAALTATEPVSSHLLRIEHVRTRGTCWVQAAVQHGADRAGNGGGWSKSRVLNSVGVYGGLQGWDAGGCRFHRRRTSIFVSLWRKRSRRGCRRRWRATVWWYIVDRVAFRCSAGTLVGPMFRRP